MAKRASLKENAAVKEKGTPLFIKIGGVSLALIQIICPLLFFTNLTRNPYYTQIALINVLTALTGLFWVAHCFTEKKFVFPKLPFHIPLLVFLVLALLSSVLSYVQHPTLHSGIFYETTRVWVFTLINCVTGLYLPLLFTKPTTENSPKISIWTDLSLAIIWALLWYGFQDMKSTDPSATLWDAYGGFLWILAIIYAVVRTKQREALQYFHLIFSVGVVAGLYGLMQYKGRDIIWMSSIQPYGGRPVSTFGNPNFLSSYVMMAGLLSFSMALKSEKSEGIGYYLVSTICLLSALSTLTRSTYMGILAGFIVLAFLLLKKDQIQISKKVLIGIVALIAIIFIFPHTPVSSVQSPLARFTEIFEAAKSKQSYGPWHQRVLIWSSAWDMVKEKPLLGKGWGCFELFYPFYQSNYLFNQTFAMWRTHANNAHNILMEMWAQTGILGTGASLWLMVTMLFGGFLIFKSQTSSSKKFLSAGLLAGLVGMVTDNFFGNVSIFFAMPAFYFWWSVGALYLESPVPVIEEKPLDLTIGGGVLILFAGLFLTSMVYFVKRWNQEVHYFMGFKYAKVDQVKESITELEEAYSWFKGEVNSNYEMGNSYARHAKALSDQKLFEESKRVQLKAVDGYQSALDANPGYDEIYFNLGVTQIQIGKTDEGIKNLETAMYINPLIEGLYPILSNQYLQKQDFKNASRVLEQGVKVTPQQKELWLNLGYVYAQFNQETKSLDCYKKALQIDPSYSQAWGNLGTLAQKLKLKDPFFQVPQLIKDMESALSQRNFPVARVKAQKIVELMPESADSHLSLANLNFYMGDIPGSIKEFEEAIRLKPQFSVAHVNLAKVYQSKGDLQNAKAHYQKALEINPNEAEARQELQALERK